MSPKCIALISGHSLLMDGFTSRLRSHLDEVDVKILDPGEPGLIERLEALGPDIIVLDVEDRAAREACSPYEVFQLLPATKVIFLDPDRSVAQLVESEQQPITDAEALLQHILAVI